MHPRFTKDCPLIEFDVDLPPGALDMSRVLFLDIDGVFHAEGSDPEAQMCFALNLSEIIQKADPDGLLPIVFSSDWRFDTPLKDLRALLTTGLGRQVVGVTPDLHETHSGGWGSSHGFSQGPVRQRECELWMKTHCPASRWLAIDDRSEKFEDGCPSLFLVPSGLDGYGSGVNVTVAIDLEMRMFEFLGRQMKPLNNANNANNHLKGP